VWITSVAQLIALVVIIVLIGLGAPERREGEPLPTFRDEWDDMKAAVRRAWNRILRK
jgi:hypothetical protein